MPQVSALHLGSVSARGRGLFPLLLTQPQYGQPQVATGPSADPSWFIIMLDQPPSWCLESSVRYRGSLSHSSLLYRLLLPSHTHTHTLLHTHTHTCTLLHTTGQTAHHMFAMCATVLSWAVGNCPTLPRPPSNDQKTHTYTCRYSGGRTMWLMLMFSGPWWGDLLLVRNCGILVSVALFSSSPSLFLLRLPKYSRETRVQEIERLRGRGKEICRRVNLWLYVYIAVFVKKKKKRACMRQQMFLHVSAGFNPKFETCPGQHTRSESRRWETERDRMIGMRVFTVNKNKGWQAGWLLRRNAPCSHLHSFFLCVWLCLDQT